MSSTEKSDNENRKCFSNSNNMEEERDDSEFEYCDPTLQCLIENKALKWIFVGGKGGVGKTTTACALAVQLAQHRRNVLIISTDPAHNISDAFNQRIGNRETPIQGFQNLFAMEINPKFAVEQLTQEMNSDELGILSELVRSIPGIDEATSFAELMRQIRSMEYDLIVFDTAPTGHTLRLLGFPSLLEKGIEKLLTLKHKFSGIFSQISSAVNTSTSSSNGFLGSSGNANSHGGVLSRLETMKTTIEQVNIQFQDENLTTFVCVCIPEFLSLYETERLVQQLSKYGIDSHCLVVNQVLFPEKDSKCRKCSARVRMQSKYLQQINDLYEDFSIVTLPLLDEEVRGNEDLRRFGHFLMNPYENNNDSDKDETIDKN